MDLVITFIFFALGLIIGSFLNVVIYRLNTNKSLKGRSACMTCQSKLKWYELVPVISFFALRGRCRTCKTKISIQYPSVELASGLIFSLLFFKFQGILFSNPMVFAITFAYYATMFSLLLVIAVYDLKHKIIPDNLSLAFGILAFIGLFVFTPDTPSGFSSLYFHVPQLLEFLSGPLVALPFVLLWLVSRGAWMGLGDGKLTIGLGWLLGLGQALSGIVLAFWSGAVIGIILIALSKKYKLKSEIPFAPYLVFGAFLAFIFGLHFFGI